MNLTHILFLTFLAITSNLSRAACAPKPEKITYDDAIAAALELGIPVDSAVFDGTPEPLTGEQKQERDKKIAREAAEHETRKKEQRAEYINAQQQRMLRLTLEKTREEQAQQARTASIQRQASLDAQYKETIEQYEKESADAKALADRKKQHCEEKNSSGNAQINEQFDNLLPMFPIELQRLIREYAKEWSPLDYIPAICVTSDISPESIPAAINPFHAISVYVDEDDNIVDPLGGDSYFHKIKNNYGSIPISRDPHFYLSSWIDRLSGPAITGASITRDGIGIIGLRIISSDRQCNDEDGNPVTPLTSCNDIICMLNKNGSIKKILWKDDIQNGHHLEFTGPSIIVTNSGTIIGGGHDGMIRIWDLEGNLKIESRKHKTGIAAIKIGPDESFITQSHPGYKHWDINSREWVTHDASTMIWQFPTKLQNFLNMLPFEKLEALKKLLISLQRKTKSFFGRYQPEKIILSAQEIIMFKNLPRLIQNNICSFLNCGTPIQLIERSEKANQSNCCIQ